MSPKIPAGALDLSTGWVWALAGLSTALTLILFISEVSILLLALAFF